LREQKGKTATKRRRRNDSVSVFRELGAQRREEGEWEHGGDRDVDKTRRKNVKWLELLVCPGTNAP
jgi:hypothetical protein